MHRLLVPLATLSLMGIVLSGCKSTPSASTDCGCSPAAPGAVMPFAVQPGPMPPLMMPPANGQPPKMPTTDEKKAPLEDLAAPKEQEPEKDTGLPLPPKS
ncbi:MAG TPA: hypothetical protein VEL76_06210 [Gemmataceae bacterium]|nr:hypothetical protein [Gemmataceae bacterium]